MLRYQAFDAMPLGDRRPDFAIADVTVSGRRRRVRETVVAETPFCVLRRFTVESMRAAPRVLVVAPLSGHFAAMLRDLVVALLSGHDVHITDWRDGRDIEVGEGAFDLDGNVTHLLGFLRWLGGGVHVVALCQGAVPALAATALLAEDAAAAQPLSLTLIAGNIDPAAYPSRVSSLLAARPLDWFARTVIAPVPRPYAGAGRRVYPAFVQRMGLTLYLARHLSTQGELASKVFFDDGADAADHPFLPLFLSVMDLDADFFLGNIDQVFHRRTLVSGSMKIEGRPVVPAAISRCGLMTVEGELDDVAAPGQTRAAHDLCPSVPWAWRRHHLEPGIGHFGTFHGRPWRDRLMPRIAEFIRSMEARR